MVLLNSDEGSSVENIIAQMLRGIEKWACIAHFPLNQARKNFWLEHRVIIELLTGDRGIQFWSCISQIAPASQRQIACGLHLSHQG